MAEQQGDGGLREGQPTRILIADDHAVLRAGLRLLLDAEPDMEVVGEAGNGVEALRRARELRPDILLLDVTMPQMSGLDVLRELRDTLPGTRVLILTMHDDEGYLREVLAAGGAGYVLKRAADVELLTAIRAIQQGGTYLHAAHTRVLFEDAADQPAPETEERLEDRLSPREIQVLRLTALGYTSREAADKLHLSPKTVDTYRARVMSKLELDNRVDLVRYAMEKGLLEEE
ncbi:MAG: response regulator [Anaerolineae bacterium]|jgi:two-component system response regulator NreC